MPFGIGKKGKGNGSKLEFVPNDEERLIVQPFLDNREIPLMDVKSQIRGDERIPELHREPLGEWVRDYRANNPKPLGIEVSSGLPSVEGSVNRIGAGERQK